MTGIKDPSCTSPIPSNGPALKRSGYSQKAPNFFPRQMESKMKGEDEDVADPTLQPRGALHMFDRVAGKNAPRAGTQHEEIRTGRETRNCKAEGKAKAVEESGAEGGGEVGNDMVSWSFVRVSKHSLHHEWSSPLLRQRWQIPSRALLDALCPLNVL